MGNYISCTLLGQGVNNKQSKAAKVIFPNGEIRNIYQHVKAAEIMLETPNYFIVNSKSLHIGKRFSALNADEDLEIANVYVMFPMKRLNSFVTAADMGKLFVTANSAAKRASFGRVRILPDCAEFAVEIEEPMPTCEKIVLPKLKLEDVEELSTPEFQHLLAMCRSRKPSLETIVEEPVWMSVQDEDFDEDVFTSDIRCPKVTGQINSNLHHRKSLSELLALAAEEDFISKTQAPCS